MISVIDESYTKIDEIRNRGYKIYSNGRYEMFRTFDLIEYANLDSSANNSIISYSSGNTMQPTNVNVPLEFSVKTIDKFNISLITFHTQSITNNSSNYHGFVNISELCEQKLNKTTNLTQLNIIAYIGNKAVTQWNTNKPSTTGYYIHYSIEGSV